MDTFRLEGLGVALVTPFDHKGNIDYPALDRLTRNLVLHDVDFLVVLGTTGEAATLDANERKEVRSFMANLGKELNVPLVAGISSNDTRALMNELTSADLTGYQAILSAAPYYNKPSQEGLYQHFSAVAGNSPLPVILYNVPGRTGVNISAATVLRLAYEYNNIIGIKEASGNFKQIEEIIHSCPDNFNVISGDDALTYPLMALGATGVISVVGNAFPHEFGHLVRLCRKGDFPKALPIHYNFQRLYDELFVDGNPAGIKCLLHEMGMIENVLRLPLVPTRIDTAEKIQNILNQLHQLTNN